MEPTRKAAAISDLLNELFDRDNSIRSNVCTICRKSVDPSIMTETEKREYQISGMCIICQDATFTA